MKRILLALLVFCMNGLVFAQYRQTIQVETLLKTDTSDIGQALAYPQVGRAEISICKVTIPPGEATGWHKHSIPVFAYVMQGELQVELKNGKCNVYSKDDCISEVWNTYHNGKNNGTDTVVLIAVYLGGDDKALSEKE